MPGSLSAGCGLGLIPAVLVAAVACTRLPPERPAASEFPENLAPFDYVLATGPVTLALGAVVERVPGDDLDLRVLKAECIEGPSPVTVGMYERTARESEIGGSAEVALPRLGGHVRIDESSSEVYSEVRSRYLELADARDPGRRSASCRSAIEQWFDVPENAARELRLVTEVVSAQLAANEARTIDVGGRVRLPLLEGAADASHDLRGEVERGPDTVVAWKWELLAPGGTPERDIQLVPPTLPAANEVTWPPGAGETDEIHPADREAAPSTAAGSCPLEVVRSTRAPWATEHGEVRVYWSQVGGHWFGYVMELDAVADGCAAAPATTYAELSEHGAVASYVGPNPPPRPKLWLGPAKATWDASGGSARLLDGQGRAWPPGSVPAGRYTLEPFGRVPVEVELLEDRNYRADSLGRLHEGPTPGAENVCRLAADDVDENVFLKATPRGTVANGRVMDHFGAVVVGDGTTTAVRDGAGRSYDLAGCFGMFQQPPKLYLLERGDEEPIVLAVGPATGGRDWIRTYLMNWGAASP